jgi:hypothetical protein
MFRFLRYDVRLEAEWLEARLGLKIAQKDIDRYRCMDDPAIIPNIYEIAKLAAEQQVKLEHLLGKR